MVDFRYKTKTVSYNRNLNISLIFVLLFVFTAFSYGQVDSARIRIKEVKAQLADGKDFCELVYQYSEDSKSVSKCGEIGFFAEGELMRGYEDAMKALKIGEFSDIVKTAYGYHIIQLLAIEKIDKLKKYKTRHILVKFRYGL